MNAKMPELKRCFEAAGFGDVKTVLATGNVVFSAPSKPNSKLEAEVEAALQKKLGRVFLTIVRPLDRLQELLDENPFRAFRLPSGSKRVVTFLRKEAKTKPALPISLDGARILGIDGRELYSAYVPGPKGPVFMTLIERTFGKDVTTRTWETVGKSARARVTG